MTVFFLNATSFGNTIGDLWEFCGLSVAFYKRVSTIMLQKSSARLLEMVQLYPIPLPLQSLLGSNTV